MLTQDCVLMPVPTIRLAPFSNRVVGLVRKGGIKRGKKPGRLGSTPEYKVVLQRINIICVIPRNRSAVSIVATLHFQRHPSLTLVHMAIVEKNGFTMPGGRQR